MILKSTLTEVYKKQQQLLHKQIYGIRSEMLDKIDLVSSDKNIQI